MRILKDQPGVDAPSVAYPKGRIVDLQTLVTETIAGDMIQLFQKLVSLASIIENGNPDNEINGFQLKDALEAYIRSVLATATKYGSVRYATSTEARDLSGFDLAISPGALATVFKSVWNPAVMENAFVTPGSVGRTVVYRNIAKEHVEIIGSVTPVANNLTIFTLPEGARPKNQISKQCVYANDGSPTGYMVVTEEGYVIIRDADTGVGAWQFHTIIPINI